MLRVLFVASTALLIALPAAAQQAAEPAGEASSLIRKPVWEEFPAGEAVDQAYPKAAFDQGIEGKVVLACQVLETGRLSGCVARSETPAGHGFADAALSLTPGFRMNTTTEDGKPAVGGTVRFAIQFSPPRGATEGADGVTEVDTVEINPNTYVDGRGVKVERPVWVRKPSGQAVNKAYPKAAVSQNLGGRVTLSCVVTDKGLVVDCKVIAEDPKGIGFGEAAVFLSRYFQMKPQTSDGQPVGGATVRIPLSFTPMGY